MRIQSAMLCSAAMVENGKLFVLGASLASWWVPEFPSVATPVLAAVIEADRDLDAGEATFAIKAVAAGGRVLLDAKLVAQIHGPDAPGYPWVLPFIAPLEIQVEEPGPIDVTIGTESGIEARIPLFFAVPPVLPA